MISNANLIIWFLIFKLVESLLCRNTAILVIFDSINDFFYCLFITIFPIEQRFCNVVSYIIQTLSVKQFVLAKQTLVDKVLP